MTNTQYLSTYIVMKLIESIEIDKRYTYETVIEKKCMHRKTMSIVHLIDQRKMNFWQKIVSLKVVC